MIHRLWHTFVGWAYRWAVAQVEAHDDDCDAGVPKEWRE